VFPWSETNTSGRTDFYVCYDAEFCVTSQSNIRFVKLSESSSRNLSCQFEYISIYPISWNKIVRRFRRNANERCSSIINRTENDCLDTIQFQCGNKCLSKHRLLDSFYDCYDDFDEHYNDSCALNQQRCRVLKPYTNITECIPPLIYKPGSEENCKPTVHLPHFPTLCDGYEDYREQNETDETNCEKWQCDNQYTRCDGVWHCRNGLDESQCSHPVCNGTRGHPCILANTTKLICLPVSNADDGKIDCLGATDERHLCKESGLKKYRYQCRDNNQTANE
jgi:hypothetical protein